MQAEIWLLDIRFLRNCIGTWGMLQINFRSQVTAFSFRTFRWLRHRELHTSKIIYLQPAKEKKQWYFFLAVYFSLHPQNSSADLSEYSPSVAWELLGVPGEFHSVFYDCCVAPYDDVTYKVQIKRRALYHVMYLIVPCAMISVLTLLVFLLPPDCNERMTVGKAVLFEGATLSLKFVVCRVPLIPFFQYLCSSQSFLFLFDFLNFLSFPSRLEPNSFLFELPF